MRKKSTLRTLTVTTGVALALAVSVAAGPGKALATTSGYLSAPDLYTTQVAESTPNTVITSAGTYTIYDVPTSSFGNTIPSTTQLQQFLSANEPGVPSNVTIDSISQNGVIDYPTTGLNLQLLNQAITNYTSTSFTQGTYSGEILSNVFRVGAGSTMAGVTPGDLVFTYQFDITSATSTANGNVGPSSESVSFYNDPNGYTYTLGDGITDTSSIQGTTISCSTCTELTPQDLSGATGTVLYDTLNNNGSIETLELLNNTLTLNVGTLTPEIMVASNATNYTMGSLALSGTGSIADGAVFVPDTPEPGTLVLFGSALGLVAFMMVRRQKGQRQGIA